MGGGGETPGNSMAASHARRRRRPALSDEGRHDECRRRQPGEGEGVGVLPAARPATVCLAYPGVVP